MSPDRTLTRLPETPPQFLSEAACHDILARLVRYGRDGGETGVVIRSRWSQNVRWARNQISTSGEIRSNRIVVDRTIRGARGQVTLNESTDHALTAAVRRAERLITLRPERTGLDHRLPPEPVSTPAIFSEATLHIDADQCATSAQQLIQSASNAGLVSAGYIEVSATSLAVLNTAYSQIRYCQYTQAQCSVTVRDAKGTASGWAGVDNVDWTQIDPAALSHIAMKKCLDSRVPVAIEPGRYTTILEPQAVGDFVGQLIYGRMWGDLLDRNYNENGNNVPGPFLKSVARPPDPGYSVLGARVADERVTISADPLDPEIGFPPFNYDADFVYSTKDFLNTGAIYHPVTWIERGVLTNLAYDRDYAIKQLGTPSGLPNSGAFRMSGGSTSLAEMIATTFRGLLVTRLDSVDVLDPHSALCRAYTRDGLWLIENGRITKAVKNMVVTESILLALNNIEQLGVPQRIFHPNLPSVIEYWNQPQPVVVPTLKVRDFNFSALADAV